MKKLDGKIAIITGANSGIGKGLAFAFAKEGAHIVLAARRLELSKETASEIEKLGVKSLPLKVDITSESDVNDMAKHTMNEFGRIDILVNNAGVGGFELVKDMSLERWNKIINTNLTGNFLCCKAVIPIMTSQKSGHIINIASVAGKVGFATGSAYCSSKWGLLGLSRCLAAEVRPYNIRVDAICPGTVDTPFPHSPAASKLMLEVDDVVQAALYLISLSPKARLDDVIIYPNV